MTTPDILSKRLHLVLSRMDAMAQSSEDDAQMFQEAFGASPREMAQSLPSDESALQAMVIRLEHGLEDLAMDDAFGTERECDPRGDGRNADWSMTRVEGLDD